MCVSLFKIVHTPVKICNITHKSAFLMHSHHDLSLANDYMQQVMAFESRHVLPLSEVESVTLLGTALDLSSSLVIATKGGGEVMLVFPGQRTATLEPVELLIRELTVLAARQNTAT